MVTTQGTSTAQRREDLQRNPWRTDIRLLFQAAMVVFVITVGIGILNGQHIVTLDANVLLTHVHAGTLGWITLSVLAMSLWLFGESKSPPRNITYVRALSVLAAVSVPVYVLAFLSGNLVARAIFGPPVLVAIVGFLIWVILRSLHIRLGVAHLAILGGLITLTIGAVIGVLLQIELATNSAFLPGGAFAAHPSTMVVGYLLLVGMAISEWLLMPDTGKLSRLGVIQITLPFIAGIALTVGLLLDIMALLGVNVLFEVAGILIYIWRFAPRIVRVSWLKRNSDRHFAISGVFLVTNVVLLTYLIVAVLTKFYAQFELIPVWLVFALDHAMFIGVMSNALFGLIQLVSWERRSFWPWVDDVLFWGMNFGMVGFVISLLLDVRVLERVFTPIMGGSILLALLTYFIRIQTGRPQISPAAVESQVSGQV